MVEELLKRDVFKVVISNKFVTLEEVSSSIQVLNSSFINNIKDLWTDKAYENSHPIIHTLKW